MSKDKLQNIRVRYNLTNYTQIDMQYLEVGSRSYIEFNGYSSAVIKNPKRRPDLRSKLKSEPLRQYIRLRSDVWFRNIELKDIAINQFKNSRRNADPPIKNSWCVTFIDKLTRSRYIFAYINGKKYIDIHKS
ncbi:hypothetical protein RI845_13500 [Thalassotalea nanhaiensis]|uniref:Uncharacterized protein n=1 Tax=Thalassotalea nanhaiensis TaxID=3065648 RepID=A0ABY9TGY0_9GAMM|nr:hypothetical protein RI845_13500 [Colwelliaceae bacterium SQ345]